MAMTNSPPPIDNNVMYCFSENKVPIIAHTITDGYIRLILLLYQLSNRNFRLLKNNVYPEANKNSTSPIAPPVASILYLGYKASIWLLMIRNTAINFRISILMSRWFIL